MVGFMATDADAVIMTLRLAAGDLGDEAFMDWVRRTSAPKAEASGAGEGNRTLLASLEG